MSIISFETYKEQFERLLADSNITANEFETIIEDLIFQIPTGAMQLTYTPFLIRTSLLDENEICLNTSRCSYPPNSIKNKIPLQRCNFKEQQVFYASIPGGMTNFGDGAQPSLMETVAQKIIDDSTFNTRIAAASRWQVIKQPLFWFLPHHNDSLKNNANFRFLFDEFDSFLKTHNVSSDNYKNFTDKLNYLSGLFCSNSNKEKMYSITATYYNKVMTFLKPEGNNYDALIYPSANTNAEGMNIVLTKDYIDKKNLYCDLVVLYTINRNPNNEKDIWFLPFAQAIPNGFGDLKFMSIDMKALN